jgi:hypothetical protein
LPNHPTLIRSTGAAIAKASLLHFYDAFSVRKLTKRVHVSVRSKVDEPFATLALSFGRRKTGEA